MPRGLKLQEVIFVDDGSIDNSKFKIQNSKLLIEKKLKTQIKLISYKKNQGKGYAIRTGMNHATADYTLFFDTDMSTPLSEIKKFVPFMLKEIDVIIGTRKNGKSTVIKHQPFFRETLGKIFTLIVRIAYQINTTDVTCGFKALSRNARLEIFPKAKINRWAYDAELLVIAKKFGLKTAEQAITWSNDNSSKVKLYTDIPQTIAELILIYYYHFFNPKAFIARYIRFNRYKYIFQT